MGKQNWTLKEVLDIYGQPFPELVYQAQSVHRKHFSPSAIQRASLMSIKTGGCVEDCSYCSQSARYHTEIDPHKVLDKETVLATAKEAKRQGSTRFCMGASGKEVHDGKEFDHVLDLIKDVADLGMEVCCTLGMLSANQAERLSAAGCHTYNHNLDTSPEFYGEIITTRTYQDRLNTLEHVRAAGMKVCCGGIVGLGENIEDRLELLRQLATQEPQPDSVPINMLVKIKGTPLEKMEPVDPIEFARLVATARILMPQAMIRLSAGRKQMSDELQTLCFVAGANSVHAGGRLLTTASPSTDDDALLLKRLGMHFIEKPRYTKREAINSPANHT